MGYIIVFLHYAGLAIMAGIQRTRRIAAETLMGARRIRGFTLWDTVYYHDGHTWALPDAMGRIRVGLDDFAARLLGTIDRITLPAVGEVVRKGQSIIKVRCGANSAWAVSPIHGIVTGVNRSAGRDPTVITRDPYGKGWILKVEPVNSGIEALHSGEEAGEWLLQESEKLHRMLTTDLGMTMADGGVVARDLGTRLSDEQWTSVVRTFLKAGQ